MISYKTKSNNKITQKKDQNAIKVNLMILKIQKINFKKRHTGKVGPRTLKWDPMMGPYGGTQDPQVGPYGGTLKCDP